MKIEIKTKIKTDSPEILSRVYTPGVGECCIEIKKDSQKLMELTNYANSIAVPGFERDKTNIEQTVLKYIKKGFSAYPLILKENSKITPQKIFESLTPTFSAFDTTHLKAEGNFIQTTPDEISLPQKEDDYNKNKLSQDVKKDSIELHSKLRGVIKSEESSYDRKLIGVISDGSAVLGFGNIGAKPAMPVMEGKSALFKELGGVDAFPICINSSNTEELIDIIDAISPTFSGINLEDICAPKCFEVEESLIKRTNIPIFHDDQHGTAIIVLAAVINFLRLTKKDKHKIKIAMSGAGAAAQSVAKLLLEYGINDISLSDINGTVYEGRENNDKYLEQLAQKTNQEKIKGNLTDIIQNADIFIGLSAANIVTPDMIKSMAPQSAVFALANPTPEIMPDLAKNAGALVVATGRSDFENQINNSLAFPGIFRGVLESGIKIIDNKIKINAAKAIAYLIEDNELAPDYILPKALDKRVPDAVAASVRDK